MTKKTTQFRRLLESKDLEFICEAHNGLCAKIVEESGFRGIWASGLTMSAALGVRDNNEASWTQVLEVLEFMSDNTSIPILVDGDTGYGNFNNMRRLVKKLEQRQVAAVCIEDKVFPKTNSFIRGETQKLANMQEFCGKIRAGKDAQEDSDFSILARTESFIVGLGLEEALKRANAYYEAGADAILVHSKRDVADDVVEFMKHWHKKCPVVIVPTTYCHTPLDVYRDLDISLVIWANQILRASIKTMQATVKKLYMTKTASVLEDEIVPVKEIFRLQGADELKEAEKKYLPKTKSVKATILAASKGDNFGVLTENQPKTMIPVKGEPIIRKLISTLRRHQVRNIGVVTGYKKDAFDVQGVEYIHNEEYENTGELGSWLKAFDRLEGENVLAYGDIIFKDYVLSNLLESKQDIVAVVDHSKDFMKNHKSTDKVKVNHHKDSLEGNYYLEKVCATISGKEADGEWIGLIKLSAKGSEIVKEAVEKIKQENPEYKKISVPDVFNYIAEHDMCKVAVQYICGDWLDIDDLEDLSKSYMF